MPETSIVITSRDNYSDGIKKMSQVTKAFDKDAEHMERVLQDLSKQKASINLDAKKAKAELAALEKQFAKTGDEADGLKVQLAQQNYDSLVRNLNLVSRTAKDAEKHMRDMGDGIVKAQNQGEASGFNRMVKAFAASGIGQMGSSLAMDVGNTFMGSALGRSGGAVFSGALSSAVSGASIGAMVGGVPGALIGGAAGGIMGAAQGALQNAQTKDEYFKQYYADLYEKAAAGTEQGIAGGSDYAAQMQQYRTSFQVMTGSEEAAYDIVKRISRIAADTPFGQQDLVSTTQGLMQNGMSQDEALGKMTMLGDISQGNAEKMKLMADAYGKMSASGKVSLERINQMTDAGFNPLTEISKSTGESVAKLYDRISKGKMTISEITASMERATSEGGMFYQSMELQGKTFAGLKSTLEDTMAIVQGGYGEGYNSLRGEGYEKSIAAYSGPLGDALEEMNSIIGSGQAYMDNLKDQYLTEAQSALVLGTNTTLYDPEHAKTLQGLGQQYQALKAEEETASDARKAEIAQEVQALSEQVQTMATAAYESSDQYLSMAETEREKIIATKNLTASFDSFKIRWAKDEALSQGEASTGASTPPTRSSMEGGRGTAFGLSFVPYDNFPTLLHHGERVLTASQARTADRASGGVQVSISGNNITVREEADIDRVAAALADQITLKMMGGVYRES